ncbi:hypothetical protein [Clostridium ihumii]|uniref:hypothetical protein n=1 Tax=Clostridium ihumii TaxID=1470356 RepID=UPI003D34A062
MFDKLLGFLLGIVCVIFVLSAFLWESNVTVICIILLIVILQIINPITEIKKNRKDISDVERKTFKREVFNLFEGSICLATIVLITFLGSNITEKTSKMINIMFYLSLTIVNVELIRIIIGNFKKQHSNKDNYKEEKEKTLGDRIGVYIFAFMIITSYTLPAIGTLFQYNNIINVHDENEEKDIGIYVTVNTNNKNEYEVNDKEKVKYIKNALKDCKIQELKGYEYVQYKHNIGIKKNVNLYFTPMIYKSPNINELQFDTNGKIYIIDHIHNKNFIKKLFSNDNKIYKIIDTNTNLYKIVDSI